MRPSYAEKNQKKRNPHPLFGPIPTAEKRSPTTGLRGFGCQTRIEAGDGVRAAVAE
ncbi:hypothetical protein V6Z11_A11G075300 [Gossypium hirsutum]